ncbi:uncharacterized protein UHO2_03222 [Ustilago hordei]|uniref:Uncharacterized protein n=1 Tax=Ustilago hordei TaxID=120017 RepID=I2G0U8_USTHO|nr:uncharacterized protein UHO2_03222 [Ustilago hordei]CCF52791.1 uncharacterized protein UHOR_04127 [Ustilago hordei]SYW84006.1 uncharacterized protein UHO2_03222 [Ustilago hordei]
MSEEISVGRISKDLDKARILMAFFGSEDQPCRHLKLARYCSARIEWTSDKVLMDAIRDTKSVEMSAQLVKQCQVRGRREHTGHRDDRRCVDDQDLLGSASKSSGCFRAPLYLKRCGRCLIKCSYTSSQLGRDHLLILELVNAIQQNDVRVFAASGESDVPTRV